MERATLLFFRSPPNDPSGKGLLISSLQALESSFFLIALQRYAHALVTCALAIESALNARAISPRKQGLQVLLTKAQSECPNVALLPQDLLDRFRQTRNRIVHSGFSQGDDSESVGLYLECGLPLMEAVFRDVHSYDLADGLLQDYTELLRGAQEVHRRARALNVVDTSYSLNAFGHLIRWCFKRSFSSAWEDSSLVRADERGAKFESLEREKRELQDEFGLYYDFECPICDDYASAVCELDRTELGQGRVVTKRLACPSCGFVVRSPHAFMSEVLLRRQVESSRDSILAEYGVAPVQMPLESSKWDKR